MVGSNGGVVTSADGQLTVSIGPSALTIDTPIRIEPVASTAPGGTGTAYRLSPSGQAFRAPIELRFAYSNTDLAGASPEALRIAYQDATGIWHRYKKVSLDVARRQMTIRSTHFSDWSRVRAAALLPASPSVEMGKTLELSVEYCEGVEAGEELTTLLAACRKLREDEMVSASDWAVYGILGGRSDVGFVSGSSAGAIFTPPNARPPQNPVSVTASIDPLPPARVLLVSNVRIAGESTWKGAVHAERRTTAIDGSAVREVFDASVVFDADANAGGLGGTFALTSGTYEAHYTLTSPSYGGCSTQGTKSGTLRGSDGAPGGSLVIEDFPPDTGMPPRYSLDVLPTGDAYDGTSNCNDLHDVVTLTGFQAVTGARMENRTFASGATSIDDTFEQPDGAGGSTTTHVTLTRQ